MYEILEMQEVGGACVCVRVYICIYIKKKLEMHVAVEAG
jgi:hypothetical protein